MRYKQPVPAHVAPQIRTSRILCDGCGRPTDADDGDYTRNEVEIEARIGDVYPEGDQRDIYEVDLCGPCFVSKVVPALAAVGITVRKRDIEGPMGEDGRVWEPGFEPPPRGVAGPKPFPAPGQQWRFEAEGGAFPRCTFHAIATLRYSEQGAEAVFEDGGSETIDRLMALPAWRFKS